MEDLIMSLFGIYKLILIIGSVVIIGGIGFIVNVYLYLVMIK